MPRKKGSNRTRFFPGNKRPAKSLTKDKLFYETKLSKHLDIKVHFIRSYVKDGTVKIVFVKSENNLADSYTKTSGFESYIRNKNYMSNVCIDV